MHKWYHRNLRIQLWNAGKYFSKLVPPFIVVLDLGSPAKKIGSNLFIYYMIFNLIATIYCCVWDFYIDWGLFRSSKKGTYGLRDQIKYPQYFYYFAMVLNLFLRFFWLLGIVRWSYESDPENPM